jgi:ankyrin repeat protein
MHVAGRFRTQTFRFRVVAFVAATLLVSVGIASCWGSWANCALRSAARDGDLGRIAWLLDSGADPNYLPAAGYPVHSGSTALMIAVVEGRTEAVRLLLSRGADPSVVSKDGHTALSWTPMTWPQPERQPIARLLLEAGADPDSRFFGEPVLIVLGLEDPLILQLLMDHGADPFSYGERGRSAVDVVVEARRPEDIRALWQAMSDAQRRDLRAAALREVMRVSFEPERVD